MTRSSQAGDLRTRMARVAVKPARPHPAEAPALRDAPPPRRRRSPLRPGGAAAPTGQSRLETLRAWGSWELTTVPTHRWHWFTSVLLGQPPE